MKVKTIIVIAGLSAITVILFSKRKIIMAYIDLLANLIPKFEGFRSTPYWDYKQWTWGYGTQVPLKYMNGNKPVAGATISRAQAFADALAYLNNSKAILEPLIRIPLGANQWAALLSFSYNLGVGATKNLLNNLNSMNWAALEKQFKQYVNAGGVVNPNLVARRNEEWAIFAKDLV